MVLCGRRGEKKRKERRVTGQSKAPEVALRGEPPLGWRFGRGLSAEGWLSSDPEVEEKVTAQHGAGGRGWAG